MKKINQFLNQHWFGVCVLLILLLATVLRFYNYENRWALAQDQARDALIGIEAMRQGVIPELGPFSQAGSFVMGPIWYWYVTLATLIYPYSLLTPWVILTASYILVVYIMILVGKEINGKGLAIVLGLFTAVSASQISQSTNLTNPSGVAILSVSAVYFGIKYVNTGRNLYVLLFPLFISIAMNIHLQSVGLLSLILVLFILRRPDVRKIVLASFGLIIPFLPLIIFEFKTNFYDTKSMINYILYDQYRIYMPNRWLTYVTVFWPKAWARIIGGEIIVGYLTIAPLSMITAYSFVTRKITRPMLGIMLSFLLIFVQLRYFRGERFDSYLIFTNPFILTLTAWMSLKLFKLNRFFGLLIILLIVLSSMKVILYEINNSSNHTVVEVNQWRNELTKKFPKEKFALYDYKYSTTNKSLPLVLFLASEGAISDQGRKIGLVIATPSAQFKYYHPVVFGEHGGYQLFDLNSSSSAELNREEWAFVNPSKIYESTEKWYLNKK